MVDHLNFFEENRNIRRNHPPKTHGVAATGTALQLQGCWHIHLSSGTVPLIFLLTIPFLNAAALVSVKFCILLSFFSFMDFFSQEGWQEFYAE